MENIDDIDYRHGNSMFKRFKLKKLGEDPDLYVQSDTLEMLVLKCMNLILLISYHYRD